MFEPIAIVGRACILPGALDPDALWTAVHTGQDLLGHPPPDRWRLPPALALTDDPDRSADRAWTDRGGYVSGFDFAAELAADPFYRDPADLLALDPLFHWVLSAGRAALRGAGHSAGDRTDRVAAMFGNLSFPSSAMAAYAEHVWMPDRQAVDPRNRFMSGYPALLLADELGLGASFALDAACASSLYAIALACARLQARELDLALAGAVCRSDDLFIHVGFCALDAMSRTGQSRPFHRDADGLVPAEGAAFVALKRLSDAVTAGDRVHGVIRGVGLSNDGRGRGLLAPATEGQARALRSAWDRSGVDVGRLSLVECHATGTPVGDATEVRTLAEVLGDRARDLPLGSLKSNLGHLITAAGAAGLIKVLGAMAHGVRPPTLHVDAPIDALQGTPFRLLGAAEPWEADRPRVAAIDAFGFGGNNAHLIVEEYVAGETAQARASVAVAAPDPTPDSPVAVVALAVRAGDGGSTAAFDDDLRSGRSRVRPGGPRRAEAVEVVLPLERLKFPPRDLEQTLAQQLMVLDAALEATDRAGAPLPRDRTAVLIGAQSDPEVCRYGARWRLPTWMPDAPPEAVAAAKDAVVPVLEAPGVVGNMPNIPANRISSQLDLGGPAFPVSQEEQSGLAALRIGLRMLRDREVDAALVGAVDLSAEAVHEAASEAVSGRAAPAGDAAVVLVLMRADDARAEGRPVLATVDVGAGDDALQIELHGAFGRAHAAAGMLDLAAAVLACVGGYRPGDLGEAAPTWSGPRAARVQVPTILGEGVEHAIVRAASDTPLGPPEPWPAPSRPFVRPAHPPPVSVASPGVERARQMPMAPRLAPAPATAAAAPLPPVGPAEMPPAPQLARIVARPEPVAATRPAAPSPSAPPRAEPRPASPPPTPRPAPALPKPPATPRQPAPARGELWTAASPVAAAHGHPSAPQPQVPPAVLAGMAGLHRQLAAAHQAYLERQHEVHAQFLGLRQRSTAALLEVARQRGAGRGHDVIQALPPAAPAPAPVAPVAPKPPPAAPKPAPIAPKPPAAATKPAPPAAPKPAATASAPPARALPAPSDLPGPKWGRAELEVLASDKISKVFGEPFARQDSFPRQVRMPEPPLLLADRVIGLDAEPGSMTTGVIWTETDIAWSSWYLHDGVMPAGVMIEAGQADLLLISWLGADFENRGERVYRLLGCTLTYSGGLPRPGDTLRYQIHVDGHANLGATRIFFFHYDCVDQHGAVRLQVREGQAGFFSDAELAESGGILWSPESGEHDATARLDPPAVRDVPRSYTEAQVLAFAAGDSFACFGAGYERLQTHVRTPRIAPPPMSFWQRVTELDPAGGPWKRGYLRAEQDIAPDDWFFQGHFKDDPCMPGTMMFEACLQAMSFLMTAYGYTIHHDGWSFEPVPDLAYDLRCRGQVIPPSRDLVYEIFVEEVHDGPWPTVYADVLCTIDGLKAFWARRVGVRLRPDFPMTSRPELQRDAIVDPVPVAHTPDGFAFGYHSLLACAWARPSEAFGKMYEPFDEGKHCARLPGPPYHFMSRVTKIDGPIGGMKIGTAIELEYDIPGAEWYFRENAHPTMPFCVLLEAALQPCGWIASYVGSALTTDVELFFRNLDGTATWTEELVPDSGTLTTKAKITAISTAGGMIIEGFDVTCHVDDREIYRMKTVFGFFPRESLANQVGITPTAEDRARRDEPCDFQVDLTTRPAQYCEGSLRLPEPMLLMLDRVTGYWPEGGAKGLGRVRSEKDVDPSEWFFKAHFYGDPVQPGSLGIEALIQLLQFYMLERSMGRGMARPRFEPLMIGREMTWKYRGQVVPHNRVIRGDLDIVEVGEDERGRFAVADGFLWVDDLRIYQVIGMGVRIVDEGPGEPLQDEPDDEAPDGEVVLDPARDGWLRDHPPTWTLPALPAMSMVDRLAGAARRAVGGEVIEVRDAVVHRWLVVDGPTRTRTVLGERRDLGDRIEQPVTLEAWRDAPDPRLSRFEPVASGTVVLASAWPEPPEPLPALVAPAVPDPYEAGHLFHGPAFRYLTRLRIGPHGASAELDPGAGAVPKGTLHQGLLDAVTHAIPHDALHQWCDAVPVDQAAYPHTVERLAVYGPPPTGPVRVEARFVEMASARQPRIHVAAVDERDRVWLTLDLLEILVPKGRIGEAAPDERVAFLRDRRPVAGLGLSDADGDATVADPAAIRTSDWLPGTVAALYRTGSAGAELVRDVAVADHVARIGGVHPGTVSHDGREARSAALPLTAFPIAVAAEGERVRVSPSGPEILDISPVTSFWDQWFGVGRWPVEDLYYSLIRRFVRRVHLADPDALRAAHGRSTLYVANHQVGVESLLFSILASALQGVSTVTLAKAEHRDTWLGRLIAHAFRYPEVPDPEVIAFFDRDDKGSLPAIVARLGEQMRGAGKSVMVHVEGTRSLSCRVPVQKMSGAFLDMAIAVGAPVVPVRFVGGLPADPLNARIEFPIGMGRQDVWIGAPIEAGALGAVPYKERKDRVIGAINALGPPNDEEVPLPGDPALQARVDARVARTGAEPPHATLLEVLASCGDLHPDVARIVAADRAGSLVIGEGPRERWLAELARRLYGPFGAKLTGS
jgi:3-oxoacyl-(acyl-carrier-protein) synthase/3-hydroxymyristoyl/3-hydroxydecanoyl-(acyl carrier protein) dehydratase/1-acyl-sn-glycerol-3-phosphate acyltransferase